MRWGRNLNSCDDYTIKYCVSTFHFCDRAILLNVGCKGFSFFMEIDEYFFELESEKGVRLPLEEVDSIIESSLQIALHRPEYQ